MLTLPVYLRGKSFYLHTRVGGVQFKRSLKTADPALAKLRALSLLQAIEMSKPKVSDFNFQTGDLSRYELEIGNGVTRVKSDGPEDHARLLETLKALQPSTSPVAPLPLSVGVGGKAYGLTLSQLLDKFLLLRKLKPASVIAVKNAVRDFEKFNGESCRIVQILVSDITRYQETLRKNGNTERTIDNKVGHLKSLLNFALKQGYMEGKNPCEGMSLLTKRQKLAGGYDIFETAEVQKIVQGEYFKCQKVADPDYYWTVVLAILTGCRVSELTSLTQSQIQKTQQGNDILVVRESKTAAGKREVPLPKVIFGAGFSDFIDGKTQLFKYAARDGKGSGNAAGKKFSRNLEAESITRGKLVFHSLRKFANNFFQKNGVEFEPRCQIFGHEIESVNVATYTNKFNADQLYTLANPSQMALWALI
ncbi:MULTISPECIES: phage integrase SAM-like domain-containing protein [unclassified Acidovorax]|uniref:phage integrase SAM-like domain-containing protein n=1 Tax=unclassified Acidovorax TaxID=2684926 RepID=UPI002882FA2F|nr:MULTISPECIES: phage integrase SAM-like domain-containing protein [unclassified Acidovorax]